LSIYRMRLPARGGASIRRGSPGAAHASPEISLTASGREPIRVGAVTLAFSLIEAAPIDFKGSRQGERETVLPPARRQACGFQTVGTDLGIASRFHSDPPSPPE
jgi:hypothetical protein